MVRPPIPNTNDNNFNEKQTKESKQIDQRTTWKEWRCVSYEFDLFSRKLEKFPSFLLIRVYHPFYSVFICPSLKMVHSTPMSLYFAGTLRKVTSSFNLSHPLVPHKKRKWNGSELPACVGDKFTRIYTHKRFPFPHWLSPIQWYGTSYWENMSMCLEVFMKCSF